MDCTTIDLNQAEKAVSSLTTDPPRSYQPKTFQHKRTARFNYIPKFPVIAHGPNNPLLLASVPITHLEPLEILRRQHGAFTSDALMLMDQYPYTGLFSLSEEDVGKLARRLLIGKSIITFNAGELRGTCYSFFPLFEEFRSTILRLPDVHPQQLTLNSKQMSVLVEFYLQMDVDLFYMKTCSFRGAEPRSKVEGLFCGKDEPEARYSMVSCGRIDCPLCHPINHEKSSATWPVIDFSTSSTHEFLNGYTTILNCPATCTTSGVVYALTCPCGQYDYIDSTAAPLSDTIADHCERGNRVMHEMLTGNSSLPESYDANTRKNEVDHKMRLYQHSARCPVALRLFLECNPIYWSFIPLHRSEALVESTVSCHGNSPTDIALDYLTSTSAVDIIQVGDYLDRVPLPPRNHVFSFRQLHKQAIFFQQFLSCPHINELMYTPLNLYKVSIIAVLPKECPMALQYMIETLFVVHAETKLNMICPIGRDPERVYGRPYDPIWCANMNHSSLLNVT